MADDIDLGADQLDPSVQLLKQRKPKPIKAEVKMQETVIDLEVDGLDETDNLLQQRGPVVEAIADDVVEDLPPAEAQPTPEPAPRTPAAAAAWEIVLRDANVQAQELLRRRIQEGAARQAKPWFGESTPDYVNYAAVRESGSGDMFAIPEEAYALDRALTYLDRHRIAPNWPTLRETCSAMATVWAHVTPAALERRQPQLAHTIAQRLHRAPPGGLPDMDASAQLLADFERWMEGRMPELASALKRTFAALHPDPLLRGAVEPVRCRARLYVNLGEAAATAHRAYNDAVARANDQPWRTLRDAVRLTADAWWQATHQQLLASYPQAFWDKLPQDLRDVLSQYRPRILPNPTSVAR